MSDVRPRPDVPAGSTSSEDDVRRAYADRAVEYATTLGSMDAVHPADAHLVTTWAEGLGGPVLDAGCGPGHWTAHLAARGVDVRGIDQVPAFVDHARAQYPVVRFDVGSLAALPVEDGSVAGVLAWYSVVHHEPAALPGVIAEFARVLRTGGALLVGFFVGDVVEPFPHAVVAAWRWPTEALAEVVRAAGFDVVEVHTRIGPPEGPRPHGALLARLRA